ncbi:Helicase conserved C-terminal domain-containing protein [Tranquillimonas rosea]|uniref:Helicase conserved C-terminal domain-containing protein n=1 Tax=Tranquillimonas rosea TaxID=641238 RepID=A0A1H9PH91_9RHOB|nr:Helicase conserved C-terminal domain-containing protein [Tranquillimonas rosea]
MIRFPEARRGLLSRLVGSAPRRTSFHDLPEDQRDLLFAIGDLRAWGDMHEGAVDIAGDRIRASHDAVASLSSASARALGLPDDVHLTLRTDVTGTLGRPDFRLAYEWSDAGRRVVPPRNGAFLSTADGERRLPLWMKRALDLADGLDPAAPVEEHWSILAAFRRALEPDERETDAPGESRPAANLAMTAFLRGLEVRIANRFSIAPDHGLGQFEVVPYSSRSLDDRGVAEGEVRESDAELSGEALAVFQYRFAQTGARAAYQLGNNAYLVVDPSSRPVLEELARVQRAEREERKAFIRNPRAFITEAVARNLAAEGAFDGVDEAGQEEMTAGVAQAGFVESREYSDRVTGTTIYERPATPIEGSGTAWLPEVFSAAVAEAIGEMSTPDLEALRDDMAATLVAGSDVPAHVGTEQVQVTPERLAAVEAVLKSRQEAEPDSPDTPGEEPETEQSRPIILDTLDNFEEVAWRAKLASRIPGVACNVPDTIVTPLRPHQIDSFDWATRAWCGGLPGILNADEQGLGKTLQTIAFLAWLQTHMRTSIAAERGPILVVAPTSLLKTWEAEVERHVAPRSFGHLTRLYGSFLGGHKVASARGTETVNGLPLLDLDWLDEAVREGRAHRHWLLTTYTTLANYQHSLGGIRFSALVMDEIQNIKNRDTIASKAAEAMNADFRIGLTGTPIENSTMDLWTIMDRLAPGALGAGADFRRRYGSPDVANMAELHARVFQSRGDLPPLGLRRLKDEVATDLPGKTRLMHPRLMPPAQSSSYDEARAKLASGGPGAALKMLHHIRSVSVHPSLHQVAPPREFVEMSARLAAVIGILERVAAAGERALVFIEHREMQFRFAELLRHFFGLNRVDVINGDTPIPRRQAIVDRFQQHLTGDGGGFDVLILGPKAAGTGLTLTAATHVVHLSRWWNPAVEEQCNDRVHRIGQARPVTVHVPLAIHPGYREHSFDCLLQSLMQRKRRMASRALWPMGDTREDLAGLQTGLGQEGDDRRSGDIVADTMSRLFERDGLAASPPDSSGAYVVA